MTRVYRADKIPQFWSRIAKRGPAECWPWTGPVQRDGYGRVYMGGPLQSEPVHRVAFELTRGPIPAGLVIDHLCRNRVCCNPAHMEPVTNGENVLRGVGVSAQHRARTTCPRGHRYDYRTPGRGYRRCNTCDRAFERIRKGRARPADFAIVERVAA